jgi:hypothetical protein
MKMQTITKVTILGWAIVLLGASSCQKEKPLQSQENPGQAVATVDQTYSEAQTAMNSLKDAGSSFKTDGGVASCATTTMDTISNPHVFTVDYGSTGCKGSDGKVRKGQIIVQFDNADYRTINDHINISFNGYSVNNTVFSGTGVQIVNNGFNTNGNLAFAIAIGVQQTLNGKTFSVNGNLGYEWIAGEATSTTTDDEFSITGSANGTTYGGDSFTFSITSPLIKNYAPGCQYFVKGDVLETETGKFDKTIDFGNGTCTGMETVTQNGVVITRHQ